MGVKRIVNFHYFCLVTLLILTDLSTLFSSPIPFMEELLNRKTSVLPTQDKGELPARDPISLLGKQVLLQQKVDETPTHDTMKSSSAVHTNFFNFKSKKLHRNANMSTERRHAQSGLLQSRFSRLSSPSALNSKSTIKPQPRGGLPLPGSPANKQRQPWEYLPIRPENAAEGEGDVKLDGKRVTEDSVAKKPATKRKVIPYIHEVPLSGGAPQINLGRLNLKTDWCVTHPFNETVHHRGCQSVQINNNMCYGQCNSFFIPKKFVSCSYCVPSKQETINVPLECPGQNPSFVIKKVHVIKECACRDCGLPKL